MVMTSIRFSDKEKLKFYQHHAKAKYHLDFSKYIKMLIREDLKALRKPSEIKEEWELIKQLKVENDLLKKEILILKHHVETLFDLNTAKIIEKLEGLTIASDQIEAIENKVLAFLDERVRGKRVRLSLMTISQQLHVKESLLVRILDDLIDREEVKLFKDMKYGRIT